MNQLKCKNAFLETCLLLFLLTLPQILLLTDFFQLTALHQSWGIENSPIKGIAFTILEVLAASSLFSFFYLLLFSPPFFLFSSIILILTYAHLLVTTPALLQVYFPKFLFEILPWAFPWLEKLIIVLALVILHLKTHDRIWARRVIHLSLGFYLLIVNDPLRSWSLKEKPIHVSATAVNSRPSIILIGVDALRFDELIRLKETGNYPWLQKFLQDSPQKGEIVAPLAKTHPSLISLLSGKTPQEHGLRQLLAKNAADSDLYLGGGALDSLKNRGYRVSVRLSDSAYSYFTAGKMIDEVQHPTKGIQNIILPFFVAERFLFAWFNNQFGRWFLPDLFENSSFGETWLPQGFAQSVQKELQQLNRKNEPQVKLFHSIRMHWPGALQFPSSSDRPPSNLLAYENRYVFTRVTPISTEQIQKNKILYRRASEQTAEFILEPVFQYLYESQLINSSVVVLFSDHGEAFFDGGLLPVSKTPKHGAGLIFGDDSEYAALAVHFPMPFSDAEFRLPMNMNMADILPFIDWVLNGRSMRDFNFRPAISETDRWLTSVGPGQFKDFGSQIQFVELDQTATPYIWSDFENRLSKRRSVYDSDGYRLTLDSNVFGYQLFLQKRNDPRGNLIAVEPERARSLWANLQKNFATDFHNRWVPELLWTSETSQMGFLDWSQSPTELIERCRFEMQNCEWLILLRSFHELNGKFNLLASISLLDSLFTLPGVSTELRLRAEARLFLLDAVSDALTPELRMRLLARVQPPGDEFKNLSEEWIACRLMFLFAKGNTGSWESLLSQSVRRNPIAFHRYTNLRNGLFWLIWDDYYSLITRMDPSRLAAESSSSSAIKKILVVLQKILNRSETSIAPLFELLEAEKHHLIKGMSDSIYIYLWFDQRFSTELRLLLLQGMFADPTLGAESLMLMERLPSIKDFKFSTLGRNFSITAEVFNEALSLKEKHQLILTFFYSILDSEKPTARLLDRRNLEEIPWKSETLRALTQRIRQKPAIK